MARTSKRQRTIDSHLADAADKADDARRGATGWGHCKSDLVKIFIAAEQVGVAKGLGARAIELKRVTNKISAAMDAFLDRCGK